MKNKWDFFSFFYKGGDPRAASVGWRSYPTAGVLFYKKVRIGYVEFCVLIGQLDGRRPSLILSFLSSVCRKIYIFLFKYIFPWFFFFFFVIKIELPLCLNKKIYIKNYEDFIKIFYYNYKKIKKNS